MMVEPSEVTDMDLYLMQHGQATTETEDPKRPLTDAGRAAVQRVAERARAADVRISGCLHSGKLRAEQTAQLLVTEIGVEASVEARPGLAPNDPVVPVAQWLRAETEHQSLALVGNMPFVGRLRSDPGQTFSRTDSGVPGAGNDVITTVTNKTVYVDVKC
jgi:phosphohistidine phosphatase